MKEEKIKCGEGLEAQFKRNTSVYKELTWEEMKDRLQELKPEPRPFFPPAISIDVPYLTQEERDILFIKARGHR